MTLNLVVCLLGLCGLMALAAASERHSEVMWTKVLSIGQRKLARTTGWVLLIAALFISMRGWGSTAGSVAWFGWLTIVAVALVFYLPKWPWQPPKLQRTARKAKAGAKVDEVQCVVHSRRRQYIVGVCLIAVPVLFAVVLSTTTVKPLLRSDAIAGTVGPWSFTFAEGKQEPPTLVAMDIPMKTYQLRFCATCDADILGVYLKLNKPRSLRGAGMTFFGARWDRGVEINLPMNTKASDLLWITVEGKDGSVHYASVPLAQVSPTTVAWFEAKQDKKEVSSPVIQEE